MKTDKLFASLSALALALGTTACGGEAEEAVATGPEAPAGITVSDGRLTLPAVAGNPGAVYFTISNAGTKQETIRAAEMLGATSAVMHETATWNLQVDMQELFQVPVMPGEDLVFAPGGKHVMVMGLDDSLQVGGETEVTLTFVGGDKVSFPVEIRAPGDGDAAIIEHSAMEGME